MRAHLQPIMALGIFLSLHQAIGQLTFLPAKTYATGKGPLSVATADINGDSKPDIIVANSKDGTVSVLTNNGSGDFAVSANYSVGGNTGRLSEFVATADVNGDGQLDIISSRSSGNFLSVLTNDGTGHFGFSLPVTFIEDSWFGGNSAVSPFDLNGDGRVDLVASFGTNAVLVLTNNGTGSFSLCGNYAANYPANVSIADVNKDSKPDLIIANEGFWPTWNNSIAVFTNAGNGLFGSNGTYTVGTSPIWTATADFNNDHSVDLACANYNYGATPGVLTVLTNDGYGVFGSNATYIVEAEPAEVIAGDFNGDGKADLASINAGGSWPDFPGTISVLTNDGNGRLGLAGTLYVGGRPLSFAVADINGNGKLDFISTSVNSNILSVFTNTTIFPTPASTPTLMLSRSGADLTVSWPSASPGWSLQQSTDLIAPNWGPSGYGAYPIINDDTNQHLTMPANSGHFRNLFFRLLHP
jgi:hypothetical protein